MKFGMLEHSRFGGTDNNGYARAFIMTPTHNTILECIYSIVDGEWKFLYENHLKIDEDEKVAFENWFIESGSKMRAVCDENALLPLGWQ